jgi:NDP-sugar pyrophosphorylase family protein
VLPTLVLTAGLGTRLDPLTRLVAKAAVPMAGSTLIERVLRWLRREGVTEAVLNLHFRPETITAVVGDGRHLGLRVRYSWEQPILGSAGGPRRALPLIDADPFLLVNGDTLCEFPLPPLIAAHAASGADVTLAVIPNPSPHHYNGIVADAEGRVTGFVPKGQAAGSWHFVGVQVARAAVFASLADGVPAETVGGLYRTMLSYPPGRLRVWPVTTPFLDVGTPADYLEAVRFLANAPQRATPIDPLAIIDPSARITDSAVWPGATVGRGATLDACIVTGGVAVPADFAARRAVLMPASVVRPGDAAELAGQVAVFPIDDGPAPRV